MKENVKINLSDILKDVAVYIGAPLGEKFRIETKINSLDKEYKTITIIIPDEVREVIPSVFQAFLKDVVKRNGREEFLRRYKFITPGFDHSIRLDEAIERILDDSSAMG